MITVQTTVNAPLKTVWKCWNKPDHIKGWAFATNDWEAPAAHNDLREGGIFTTTMAAKDGSTQFDLVGSYTSVKENELIEYTMEDGRKVRVEFKSTENGVEVTESFDPENENPEAMQRQGWQAILDNFKKHTESH